LDTTRRLRSDNRRWVEAVPSQAAPCRLPRLPGRRRSP